LITFSTDVFHPLLTSLTTLSYSTGASDSQTVSASDRERLPPGGFSLRHGFPQWYSSSQNERSASASTEGASAQDSSSTASIGVYEVLDYLRLAFNDENFLNSIPLEACANSGAYHAWHTYRARKLQSSRAVSPQSTPSSKRGSGIEKVSGTLNALHTDSPTGNRGRRPGEWNWDGVWEERVRRGIHASLSEPVLFGSAAAADEAIRFADLDATDIESIQAAMFARQ
jgi:hypothetical protein